MPIKLTQAEIEEMQQRYHYLINYESDDPCAPIDPLTYTGSGGDHLIHTAAALGDLRTVELLVKAGVDVNRRGEDGCTALHYARWKVENNDIARMKGRDDVARFLLAHGASEDILNDFGDPPGAIY